MKNRYLSLLILAFFFQIGQSRAQASLMDDISYVYLEKLIATAKENYPRLNTNRSRMAIAKSNLISQQSNWLDGLSFSYVYKPNNTLDIINPTFFNGYQVAISFSVTELFQKSANVKQARETVKLTQFETDEYNLTLEKQVKTLYFDYLLKKKLIMEQNKQYVDAQNMNTIVNARYLKGETTFAEYTQAQMALSVALQSKWAAEAAWQTAIASLEELTVKKLEEIK